MILTTAMLSDLRLMKMPANLSRRLWKKNVPPTNNEASRVEASINTRYTLRRQKSRYIGINMDAHVALPQL